MLGHVQRPFVPNELEPEFSIVSDKEYKEGLSILQRC